MYTYKTSFSIASLYSARSCFCCDRWLGCECEACFAVIHQITSWLVCPPLCAVLPLPSASVNAVVCDLPFGRKFGTKTNMAANLPLIVTEMERFVPLCVCFHCFRYKCSVNQKMLLVFSVRVCTLCRILIPWVKLFFSKDPKLCKM